MRNKIMKSLFDEDVKNEIIKDFNQENTEESIHVEEIPIQSSGSFYRKGDKIVTDIRLEFDSSHPKYLRYIRTLQNFVKKAEKDHVLFSSSGI